MSYLIVDNNVNGAIGGVVGQVTQVEGLIHNTLAGKGGITMDQNTHHLQNEARHRQEDKLIKNKELPTNALSPKQPIKEKLLLSIYSQLCVVQYGEIGR